MKKDQKELDLKVTAEITREQLCTRSLLLDSSMIKVTFFAMSVLVGVGMPSPGTQGHVLLYLERL